MVVTLNLFDDKKSPSVVVDKITNGEVNHKVIEIRKTYYERYNKQTIKKWY